MEPKDQSEADEKPEISKAAGRKSADAATEPETTARTDAAAPIKTETEAQSGQKTATTLAESKPSEPAEQQATRTRSNATLTKDSNQEAAEAEPQPADAAARKTDAVPQKEKEALAPVDGKVETVVPKPADEAHQVPDAVDTSDSAAVETRLAAIQNQIKLLEAETQLATKQAEQATAAEEAKRTQEDRKAIRELLDAHKGNIPAIIQEVNKELQSQMRADKSLVLDNRLEFSQADSLRVRLPTEQLSLTGSSDFFALRPAPKP